MFPTVLFSVETANFLTQGVPLCSLGDVACSREELGSGLVCITGAEIQLQLISVDEFIVEKNETTLTIDGGGLIEKDSSVIAQMLALNIFEGHRISPHTVETQNHRHHHPSLAYSRVTFSDQHVVWLLSRLLIHFVFFYSLLSIIE
jgi:hypothetical protein